LYFLQVEDSLSYSCLWCPKIVKASSSSYYNLKIHCDGSNIKGTIQAACPGRSGAIAAGAKLPPTAAQAGESKEKPANTIALYMTKGRFDNNTFNKLMVFWLIENALPWARFEDRTLRISLDYSDSRTKLHSRTWAAKTAQSLYLSLQRGVLAHIKVRIKPLNSIICATAYHDPQSLLLMILGFQLKDQSCFGCLDNKRRSQGIPRYNRLLYRQRLGVSFATLVNQVHIMAPQGQIPCCSVCKSSD
jgi:hypothetical protein